MKKEQLLIFAGLLFLLISCTNKSSTDQKTKSSTIDKDKFANAYSLRLNSPESVALSFYNWYLKDIYLKKSVESPELFLNEDSVYVLDPRAHIKFLNESGYFSTKFYENEVKMFDSCNDKLSKINPHEVEDNGYFPPELAGDDNCRFLECMIWTLGQGETLNTAKVKSSTIDKDSANVIITIGDTLAGDFSYSHVTLLKEKDKWKISRIRVDFDKNNSR